MSWAVDTRRFVRFVPRLAEELEEPDAAALRDAPWDALAAAAALELAEAAPALLAKGAVVLQCCFDHEGAGHSVLLDGDHREPAFADGPIDPASVLECADLLASLPARARHAATIACVHLVAEVLAQHAARLGPHAWTLTLVPEHDASPRRVCSSTSETRSIFDAEGQLIERSLEQQIAAAETGAELAPLFAQARSNQAMELLGKAATMFVRLARAPDLGETSLLLSAISAHATRLQLASWGSLFEETLANALCCVASDAPLFELVASILPEDLETPLLAHNLACVTARLHRDRAQVLHWIERALELGREPEAILADPDLAALRDDPALRRMLATPSTPALAKALGEAIGARDLAKVKELVDAGADVRGTYDDGLDQLPMLIVALSARARKAADREARLAICRYLLERGALVAPPQLPWYKVTDVELVELLLDHGVPVTPALVKQTVERGALPLLERLVARGLDLREHAAVELLQACRTHDKLDTLAWLLAHGLAPDAHNDSAYPALLSYASAGNVLLAEALVAAGGELAVRDRGGGSVISHALFNDKDAFVTWAIDRGADLTVVDHAGRGLVGLALAAPKCLPLLLARGAPVDLVGEDGRTALHLAAEANNLDAARQLLAAGASRDVIDREGNRPADLAKGALKQLLA